MPRGYILVFIAFHLHRGDWCISTNSALVYGGSTRFTTADADNLFSETQLSADPSSKLPHPGENRVGFGPRNLIQHFASLTPSRRSGRPCDYTLPGKGSGKLDAGAVLPICGGVFIGRSAVLGPSHHR
jgi:hypothetical protein